MTTPAVLALTEPAKAPSASVERLRMASTLFATLERQSLPALILKLSQITRTAADLLESALARRASDADLVSLSNSARVLKAAAALLREQAVRQTGTDQINTMLAAKLTRKAHADVHLTQREYLPLVYQQLMANVADLRIRILPGAESALRTLARDQLLEGAGWDIPDLSGAMVKWVQL